MPTVRYREPLNVLVVAKGHPYLRDPFMAMFDEMEGVSGTLVEQPAAQRLMSIKSMTEFDALVLYDMPGLDFQADDRPGYVEPSDGFKNDLLALLEGGTGVVALHHALAGWPAWPEYAELLGGRFLYKPGLLRGVSCLDSGYRHDVTHTVSPVHASHPIMDGIDFPMTLTDELYLAEIFDNSIEPLLVSSHAFKREGFYSAAQAVAGRMFSNEGWQHPDGSNVVGWIKRAGRSPLVYLQPGDGPATYEHPGYRRLIRNAIHWVTSDAARQWARTSGKKN